MTDLLERAARLRKERTSFVLATVVASYPPQSVRAGAKAVILADGSIEGWIGGGCLRPVVLDEAREALAVGTPRLVRMNAGAGRSDHARGVRDYPMTCQGEGGVEIYLEPMLPAPRLCVLGETPVADALRRLATEIGHLLVDAPGDAESVVVATMGVGDEDALAAAAASHATYLGLVASRKKAQFLLDYARANGVPNEQLARVKAPAGLDLGGMSPGEIALSILAEIIQSRRHPEERSQLAFHPEEQSQLPCHPEERSDEGSVVATDEKSRSLATLGKTDAVATLGMTNAVATLGMTDPPPDDTAVDPICGMTVDKTTAKHTLAIGGETYYFCCPHCKTRFAKAHA